MVLIHPPVTSFNSHTEEHNPTCLANAQVELLNQISNGLTILARRQFSGLTLLLIHYPGRATLAPVSFSRERDRSREPVHFFTTMARQLVVRRMIKNMLAGLGTGADDGVDVDPDVEYGEWRVTNTFAYGAMLFSWHCIIRTSGERVKSS